MEKNELFTALPRKKTKIVATISDRNCAPEFITELYKNGLNVVRINTAHQSPADSLRVIENVRAVSDRIAIMIDTKGPEVRTNACDEPIPVEPGQIVKFRANVDLPCTKDEVNVNFAGFVNEVPVKSQVLIDDGELQFIVTGKEDGALLCMAVNGGEIKSRKSINVPNVSLNVPALSDKDKEYIRFCAQHNVDFIAHSFVRHKEDLQTINAILEECNYDPNYCHIISKIENQEGVDNIDEIIDHCYGIMIARGDLAVEIPRQKIPVVQKMIVNKCIEKRKPVIVATQMLHTMMDNPSPTRAEVSDVANAIFDGTDAIMLSGETAYGKYPVEAIRVMLDICNEVESAVAGRDVDPKVIKNRVSAYLCKSSVEAAGRLEAKAIFADTIKGSTIRNLSGFRSSVPVHAICYNEGIMRALSLSYGVSAFKAKSEQFETAESLEGEVVSLSSKYSYEDKDLVVMLSGSFGADAGASDVRIATLGDVKANI